LLAGCSPAPPQPEEAAASHIDAEPGAEFLESQRLADLWVYHSTAIVDVAGRQKSATTHNLRPDPDDPASFAIVPTVQLVLRNDPRWGQSVYLVVEEGHFACGRPCAFLIGFDAATPRRFAGKASSTGTRPALFIEDAAGFIRALDDAKHIEIAPADGRSAAIVFAVGGFDAERYRSAYSAIPP